VIRRIGIAEPGVRLVRSWWSSAAGETSRSADCVACAAAAPAPVRVVWSCCAIAGAGRDASARSQQQVAPPPEKPVGPPSCEAAGSRASIRQGRFIAPGAAAPREKTKAARGATSLIAGLPAIQSTSNEGYAGGRKRLRVGWRNGWRDLAYLESNVRPERRGDTLAQWEGAASDEALMDAYARGDAAAFEVFYERWHDRLFGYLARAFDSATAEELFQTLWMRIHGARGGYDRARAVAPWVFAIAANLRREEWRRRSRRPEEPRPDVMPAGSTGSAEDSALAVERDRAVRSALAALPETQREVIELHRFEHLSFPQIAEVLGEGVEAVKSRAFRGYKALRVMLTEMKP